MINNFHKVTNGLYRGSAPSKEDVYTLKHKYGINKIVSLDYKAGKNIENVCKKLHIKHIMLPLNANQNVLNNLLNINLYNLLINNGPTFIHCIHGKDCTGLVIAMFKCKYMNMSYKNALKEAELFGFMVGVEPSFQHLYKKTLRQYCLHNYKKDNNSVDDGNTIVSLTREDKSDPRDSFLDEATRSSFSPYLSKERQYPFDQVYSPLVEQSQTRENYNADITINDDEKHDVPLIGQYDNAAGLKGIGPVENYGGFIVDANLNMKKKAYSVQMTYDISEEEKESAKKALKYFSFCLKLLDEASEYLNIMKTPFKDNNDASPEAIWEVRGALRKFRDNSLDKFNNFKKNAFACVFIMNTFSFDTQTLKLMKSFISSIADLKNKVNDFIDLFSDLKSKDFVSNSIKLIEQIQQQSEDIEDIINERIKNHIQENILAKSWIDDVGEEIKVKIEKKKPLLIDLYQRRNNNQDFVDNRVIEKT